MILLWDVMKMKKTTFILIILLMTITTFFCVEFHIIPTQEDISAEIDNPKLPLELPEVNLSIWALYSDTDYSFSARRLERITLGGSLKIFSPIRLDQLVGYCSCGGYEYFGIMYPYSKQFNKNQFDILGETVNPNWKNVLDKIEKGKFEQTVLNRFLNEGIKSNIGETHYQYYHINVPEKVKGKESPKANDNKSPQVYCQCPEACIPSVIRLGDISANRVHLALVNTCCNDIIYINSITAHNIDIFNYGCTIMIGRIDAKNKVRIFNFYGDITIGKTQFLRTIPAKLTVELKFDGINFGIQSKVVNEVIINNENKDRIFYKWGTEEEFQVFDDSGVQKLYTGDNAFEIMKEKKEDFMLKLDISQDWYNFPAGEYNSTLYFTVEPLDP